MMRTRWLSLGVWLVAFGIAGALSAQTVEAEAQTKKKEKPWYYFTIEAETTYIGDSLRLDLPSSLTSKLTAEQRALLNTKFTTSSLAFGGSLRAIMPVNSPVALYNDVTFLLGGYLATGSHGNMSAADMSAVQMLAWVYYNLGVAFPIPLNDTVKLIPAVAVGFNYYAVIVSPLAFQALGLGLMVDLSLYGHVSKSVALTGGLRASLTPLTATEFDILMPGFKLGISSKDYVRGGISAHFGVAFKIHELIW